MQLGAREIELPEIPASGPGGTRRASAWHGPMAMLVPQQPPLTGHRDFSKPDTTDSIGASNQRFFADCFSEALALQARHGSPVSVMRFDVDDFAQIVDSYGHHVGNGVLRVVSASVQRILNPEDVLACHGGDAFAVFVRGISARNAAILAERIRRTVNALPLTAQRKTFHVSVSVGVACALGTDPLQASALFAGAERAVSEAKSSGRNRVSCVIVE